MKRCKLLCKSLCMLLCLTFLTGALPISTFAEQTQDSVEVPTLDGTITESVQVTVTVNSNNDGTTTTTKETAEGGVTAQSGLIVEYESTQTETTPANDETNGELIKAESKYSVTTDDSTAGANGGSSTNVSKGNGSEGTIALGLVQNGEAIQNSEGNSNTASIATTPTADNDKLKSEDSINYDQTTVTSTDRTTTAKISKITVKVGDPVFQGDEENIEPSADDGYYYYWINGYDGIGDDIDPNSAGAYEVQCNIVDKDGKVIKTIKSEIVYNMFVKYVNPDDAKNGELTGGLYCVDLSTDANTYSGYRKVNLEDAADNGYYSKDDAALLRAIMNNGFIMGVDDEPVNGKPTGVKTNEVNLASFTDKLNTAKANGTLTDETILTVLENESLSWKQAAVATQMAIWSIANRVELEEGQYLQLTTGNETINALAKYLLNLSKETANNETQIITEEKFVNDMDLIVGEITQKGNDDDSDIYNVGLKFSLDVTPTENDNLIVKVLDKSGKTITQAQIPRTSNDTGNDFAKAIIENGTTYYMLNGLQLAENSDITFTLKLEGTQYLSKGVYVFQSRTDDDGNSTSQNLIGVFEGNSAVDIGMNVNLKFNVEEATITTTREYRSEWGGNNENIGLSLYRDEYENNNNDDDGTNTTDKENNNGNNYGIGGGDTNTLSGIPKTGDSSNVILWFVLMLACGIGIWKIFGYIKNKK